MSWDGPSANRSDQPLTSCRGSSFARTFKYLGQDPRRQQGTLRRAGGANGEPVGSPTGAVGTCTTLRRRSCAEPGCATDSLDERAAWRQSMTPVKRVLADLRAIAKDQHVKGSRFEQLMLHAFQTDRTFSQQFSQVWMWMDWPDRGGADIGVDLVARNVDGALTAIQCKCYAPTTTLTKEDIDSFVAASGKQLFSRRIIVATTDLWSTHAEKSLQGHTVPVERIGIDDLDAMTVDWSSYDVTNPTGLAPTPPRAPTAPAQGRRRRPSRVPRRGLRQADYGVRHGQDLHCAADR